MTTDDTVVLLSTDQHDRHLKVVQDLHQLEGLRILLESLQLPGGVARVVDLGEVGGDGGEQGLVPVPQTAVQRGRQRVIAVAS